MDRVKNITPSVIFLALLGIFFLIYSEIKMRESNQTYVVTTSDAMFYHEYIAVHIFGMEPYLPRDKKPVIKYTMGMAITYMPAIGLGYVYSEIKGVNHDYGKNYIYQKLLYYLGFFYCFTGLIFLRRLLKKWCNEWVVILTLAITFFGTNLYYYVKVEPGMSHATSFAFITAFVHYCFEFLQKPSLRNATGIGIFIALTALIRPVNIIVILIPCIYLITQKSTWANKFAFIKNNIFYWLLIGFCVLLAFTPQMIYWHHYTGKWLYYSYRQEGFFWNKPAILQILFSFRKGWLIYTPIMVFIVPGAIVCYKKNKALFWSITLFTVLNLYIISCWWCWWYGGGFGVRSMIDTYGVLAVLIGMFLQFLWDKSKPALIALSCVLGFLVYVNLYQTRQARICLIHYDSMTYRAYKLVFLNEKNYKKCTEAEWNALLDHPSYERAAAGERFW